MIDVIQRDFEKQGIRPKDQQIGMMEAKRLFRNGLHYQTSEPSRHQIAADSGTPLNVVKFNRSLATFSLSLLRQYG